MSLVSTHAICADYYWIGGSGDWSDISHWATTSGGALTHSQAPTPDDDVYFDNNSFNAPGQIVNLNTDIIFFRNMDWSGVTGNPVFQGGMQVQINAYGSIQLIQNMEYNFQGAVVCTGSNTNNTIDFAGHRVGQDLIISGAGAWGLNGSIQVDSSLQILEGSLNTNDQAITCAYLDLRSQENRVVDLGSSIVLITGEKIDFYYDQVPERIIQPLRIDSDNLTLDPGTSVIELSAGLVELWFEGSENIRLNEVIFSNGLGDSRIRPWNLWNDPALFPSVNINRLELNHDVDLYGDQTIRELILATDHRFSFESESTYSISNLQALGNCIEAIAIQATDDTRQAIINTDQNNVLDYLIIRSINVTGSGAITANNSLDLGNNSGLTFNLRNSETYYWIGNSGNWNDPSHWSFTSGGVSSGCIPSSVDDVIFDANSFNANGQEVTINVENAYCRTMDWRGVTNNPNLNGPLTHAIRVSASLFFVADMQHEFEGDYFFESEITNNRIQSAGQTFNNNLSFIGGNGEWILEDELYVERTINLNSGTWRTNDMDVYTNRMLSDFSTPRTLELGNSRFVIETRNNRTQEWIIRADNMNFDAGNSIIENRGNYSGLHLTQGNGDINYNVLLFTAFEVRLYSWMELAQTVSIDSIIYYREGYIGGRHDVNYMYLDAGSTYNFTSNELFEIEELDANGNCEEGLITIKNNFNGNTTPFQLNNDHTLERLSLNGFDQQGTGTLIANNSLDLGNNSNWTINELNARTLYWVHSTEDWLDQTNWSLSSGGPGGECIPTPIDDVIFDGNSFTAMNQRILNLNGVPTHCHNMTWTADINLVPGYYINIHNLYGNLDIQCPLDWYGWGLYLYGDDSHSLRTSGNQMRTFVLQTDGDYNLADDLLLDVFNFGKGRFDTRGFDIEADRIYAEGFDVDIEWQLNNSNIIVKGENQPFSHSVQIWSQRLNVDPGNSKFILSNQDAGIESNSTIELHNIHFNEATGSGEIAGTDLLFNSIRFDGNGEIQRTLTSDTLLCAPGKTYILQNQETQRINEYWQIIGNNCTPVALQSSQLGSFANVEMPAGGRVLADFVQMRDINALGGANFRAGSRSTDIDNSNQGWIFDDAPEFIDVGFLGPDRALCDDTEVELNAYNFSPGESYLWYDGTRDSINTVNQTGIYSVLVTFDNNCEIRDTVEIFEAADFVVDILDDPVLCEGDTLLLNANPGVAGAFYTWQDGTTSQYYEVTSSGEYSVLVDLGGCIEMDTTEVIVLEYPSPDLGIDKILCEGDAFTLDPNTTAEQFLWNDGSDGVTLSGDQAGLYWVETSNDNCAIRDSVMVTYISTNSLEIGMDTTLCDQTSFQINTNLNNADYTWQDGSNDTNFTATQSGLYWVIASISGCETADSIQLNFQNNPAIDFDELINACTGDDLTLEGPDGADTYLWNDGSAGQELVISQNGIYNLEATFGICIVRDTSEVVFYEYPIINDLGRDTVLCDGESLILSGQTNIGMLSWQDGSVLSDFSVMNAGMYILSADNNGCVTADSIEIQYQAFPNLDLVDFANYCEGSEFIIDPGLQAENFEWQDGSTGDTFSGSLPGWYYLSASNGNCAVLDSIQMIEVPLPFIDLGEDIIECDGTPVILDAGNVALWQDGSEQNSFEVDMSGLYRATVTVDGCSNSDSVIVDFLPLPIVDLGPDLRACDSEEIRLQVPDNNDSFMWEDGSSDLERIISENGIYWLELEDDNGCVYRDSIETTFAELPQLNLGPDTMICDGFNYRLIPDIGIGSFSWLDGNPTLQYAISEPGIYYGSLSNDGCVAVDSVDIDFAECTLFTPFVPNVFSPNDDGRNDFLTMRYDDSVEILEYKMEIFNRWGAMIFESQDASQGWDGRFRDRRVDSGVYVYLISVTYIDDMGVNSAVLQGDVTLIR